LIRYYERQIVLLSDVIHCQYVKEWTATVLRAQDILLHGHT